MRVIVKEVHKQPEVREVKNELSVLQELVGGYIEVVRVDNDVLLICNEEGKLQGLQPNFSIGHDTIVGTAVFVGFDGKEDFASLDDMQMLMIMDKFN